MLVFALRHVLQGAPPLVPLEPYAKLSDPNINADEYPQLCPARDANGCSYTVKGSFVAADAMSGSWNDFVQVI